VNPCFIQRFRLYQEPLRVQARPSTGHHYIGISERSNVARLIGMGRTPDYL
jgi:hypothetical protein